MRTTVYSTVRGVLVPHGAGRTRGETSEIKGNGSSFCFTVDCYCVMRCHRPVLSAGVTIGAPVRRTYLRAVQFHPHGGQFDFVWLSPHVRPMGRTCGEPDEIKKIPTRKILPLFSRSRTSRSSAAPRPRPGTRPRLLTPCHPVSPGVTPWKMNTIDDMSMDDWPFLWLRRIPTPWGVVCSEAKATTKTLPSLVDNAEC